MYSDNTIFELVDLVYGAAAEPSRWAVLLERMAKAVHGEMGSLHHQRGSEGESSFSSDWNVDPRTINLYTSYYGFRNPLMTTNPRVLKSGKVNTTQTLCGDKIFVKSEYYNDFLRGRNWCQCLALTLRKDDIWSSNITIFRAVGAEPFGKHECQLAQTLMPHLQHAFQLHDRIQGLERKCDVAADALDRLPQAVLLLDAKGKAFLANRAANAIFASEKTLKLTSQGLVALIPSESRQLNALIQGAITTGNGKGLHPGGAVTISRHDFHRPLQVLVMPLRSKTTHLGKDVPVVAVFISDPDRKPASNSGVFAQLYGLTRAEARLAQVLAGGTSLRDAADTLGIAQSTVRSQLKSIFAKTHTNRQSELIRLLLASTGAVQTRTVDAHVLR